VVIISGIFYCYANLLVIDGKNDKLFFSGVIFFGIETFLFSSFSSGSSYNSFVIDGYLGI
jgi:hypothetical protein